MGSDKRIEQRKLRLQANEKKPVNRKALLLLFFATGLGSMFFWWRGRVIRETPPKAGVDGYESPSPTKGQIGTVNRGQSEVSKRKLAEERLVEEIEGIAATTSGRYAVQVYRLGDKSGYGFNQNDRMPAASIMKVPVMAAAWREIAGGRLNPSDVYTLDEADRATGSGPLQFKAAGTKYTVEELLTYLGKNSDNTAWVMFNRRLGKKLVETTMSEMGMTDSSYDDLVITAADTVRMFEYIYNGRAGGIKSRDEIFGYLVDSIYEERIPAGIPMGRGWKILAHKVGTDAGVWSDSGIIELGNGDIVIVILNQEVKRSEAAMLVPDLVRRICEFEEKWSETR